MATSSEIGKESKSPKNISQTTKEKVCKQQLTEDPGDEDLNELLDSALEDFEKVDQATNTALVEEPPEVEANENQRVSSEKKTQKPATVEPPPIPPMQEALFNNIFNNPDVSEDMLGNMGEAFAGIMSDFNKIAQMPEFKGEMDRILQETMGASGGEGVSAMPSSQSQGVPSSPADFAQTLGETMTRLAENTQEAKDGQIPQEELFKAFENLNMESGDEMLLPMVQNMMENLLSKDVLYPSLKEVTEKYPQWLDENKETLSETDYERYCKQQGLMVRICGQYEAEKESDTEEVKQKRVTKIMGLIQEMESYGEPPKAIVGEMQSPGFSFGGSGMPNIPGLPQGEQCSIM